MKKDPQDFKVEEAHALASWRMLHAQNVKEAAGIFLRELLKQDPKARSAFLALATGGEVETYWGIEDSEQLVENPVYYVNHRAVRRCLAGEETFIVDGMADKAGHAFGPEFFAGTTLRSGTKLVASVRRPLGHPQPPVQETMAVENHFRSLAPALEYLVLIKQLPVRHHRPAVSPAIQSPAQDEKYFGLTCRSPAMKGLAEKIRKIKDTEFNVCIFGESGSGKELVARAIHTAGNRSQGPFVAESCSAIADSLVESELFGHVKGAFTGAEEDKEGLFVLADGGSLYLDEIGDMSPLMQAKLLRVIEDGKIRPVGADSSVTVNVRVISSTFKDLDELTQQRSFRSDLYWLLNVLALEIPPHRDRKEDIPLLVNEITESFRKEGLKPRPLNESALRAFQQFNWPGNVRQLQTVLRRLYLTCEKREIGKKDFLEQISRGQSEGGPAGSRPGHGESLTLDISAGSGSFRELVAECEKAILLNALRKHAWNKSMVTRKLDIPRQTLYNKIEDYGLTEPENQP